MAPTRQLFVATTGDDTAAGTSDAPLRTVQAGFDAATPGTAVMIRAGTYTENIHLTHSGALAAPIWLVSADGAGAAHIVAADVGDSTIQGYAVHDLVLQGLDVTAPAPTLGDSDGIKFAADGDVSLPASLNARLAVVDCLVHCPTVGGYNGVKISSADGVFIVHDSFDGAGGEGSGDALDFVGNTQSEIAFNYATGVPTHAAFQIKGGSTTVVFHHNLVADVGADGLWVGGGTVDTYMRPSSAYEACNVIVHDNVVHDVGHSALSFLGSVNARVTHLVSYAAGSHYVQGFASVDHDPAIASTGNRVLDSVFDPNDVSLVYDDAASGGMVTVDPASDLPLRTTSMPASGQTFTGSGRLVAGGGHDTFVLTRGDGPTVIDGFQTASDLVRLTGFGLTRFEDLRDLAHGVGPAVMVLLPDGFVLLLNDVALADLSAANFVFVP